MEILSSTDISGEVIKLIDSARQNLVLVSAYFDPWERLSTELHRAATRPGLKTVMLLRGGNNQAKHAQLAADLVKLGMKVEYLDHLHAKVYLSESQAIVTSMNLLRSSALNSWEIAVRLDRQKDAAAFTELDRHVAALLTRAQEERSLPRPAARAPAARAPAARAPAARAPAARAPAAKAKRVSTPASIYSAPIEDDEAGACIRCGADIEYDPERPMCSTCYREWAKWSNEDYEESYCHSCGEEHATSFAKPLCRPCWREQ